MSQAPSEPAAAASTPPDPPRGRTLKTLAFVTGMAVVLGAAAYFGAQDTVPRMPNDAADPQVAQPHTLRINLKGELVGTDADPPVDPATASQPGFALDKKAAEKRVNQGCVQCHAKLPEHHPPKPECIKCHRMKPRTAPAAPAPAP